jgi:hypothetical protein
MAALTVENVYELVKKHGLLALVALMLNNRLSVVEERLYDCYEDQLRSEVRSTGINEEIAEHKLVYAILPQDPVGKIKRS